METVLAFVVGALFAGSVYLMLSRSLVKFVFGLVLISNAANLLIFASGRLTLGEPPLVPEGLQTPGEAVANALPQALILTAIVISFGLLAFALVLAYRANQELGTVDTDKLRTSEQEAAPEGGAAAAKRLGMAPVAAAAGPGGRRPGRHHPGGHSDDAGSGP
jgi:multicomponent Na+:H+ antiporter subunit C